MESSSSFERTTFDKASFDRTSSDRTASATDAVLAGGGGCWAESREGMQQESSTRTSQASLSAALAAAHAASRGGGLSARFPGEDGGGSLAEMAQRDLDAALQLLTDRAQYITGSSGAAIALRRTGTNDMLCRASSGSNAPELGTLLSTEFGLSGESVRTRRALRCDDAERDSRVNQEVCREVGIASVVVMPVVHDDEVLGVFELFSGKAHAFGERDLSALQRLSEMVETAVRLARATEAIPRRIDSAEVPAAEETDEILQGQESDVEDSSIEDPMIEVETEAADASPAASRKVDGVWMPGVVEAVHGAAEPAGAKAAALTPAAETRKISLEPAFPPVPAWTDSAQSSSSAASSGEVGARPAIPAPMPTPTPAKKPLFWSAAASMSGDASKTAETDLSQVPAAFRNLRKCEACGFPISPGRSLCVECEEKKWRGQLKMSRPAGVPSSSGAASSGAGAAAAPAPDVRKVDFPTDVTRPLATASPVATSGAPKTAPTKEQTAESSAPSAVVSEKTQTATAPVSSSVASPELVFSAAVEPSQSWLARNKYVLGAMALVAATVVAILALR
jgi:hypothetical protein